MANVINATSTGNGGLITQGDDSGILNIQTNETTAITVDASQNVGIGTASPANKLSVVTASGADGFISVSSPTTETAGVLVNGGTSSNKGAIVRFQKNASTKWTMGTDSAIIGSTSDNFHLYGGGADSILFSTNATERMRIDSSGNLLVGTTTSLANGLTVTGGNGPQLSLNTTTRFTQFNFHNSGTQKSAIWWDNTNLVLQTYTGTTNGPYVAQNGTSWTSSSDERLKNITGEIQNGLAKVCTLRAAEYTWKADAEAKPQVGLIAQDVLAVLPEAVQIPVEGATEKDGSPTMMGVQYTEVIPLLVASIKELKAINDTQAETINALTARIVALEQA